jgi:hypothetical protein
VSSVAITRKFEAGQTNLRGKNNDRILREVGRENAYGTLDRWAPRWVTASLPSPSARCVSSPCRAWSWISRRERRRRLWTDSSPRPCRTRASGSLPTATASAPSHLPLARRDWIGLGSGARKCQPFSSFLAGKSFIIELGKLVSVCIKSLTFIFNQREYLQLLVAD